ncbi:hypothetical protein AMTRI_Chr01g127310 [Amborella trichopoda]
MHGLYVIDLKETSLSRDMLTQHLSHYLCVYLFQLRDFTSSFSGQCLNLRILSLILVFVLSLLCFISKKDTLTRNLFIYLFFFSNLAHPILAAMLVVRTVC